MFSWNRPRDETDAGTRNTIKNVFKNFLKMYIRDEDMDDFCGKKMKLIKEPKRNSIIL